MSRVRQYSGEEDLDLDQIPDTVAHVYVNEDGEKRSYNREFKIQAAYHFIVTGSGSKTAERMQVDKMLISQWKDSDWWPIATAAARRVFSREIEGKMAETMLLAQEAIVDRLQNGEIKIGRDGEEKRIPVSAKDAAVILSIGFDKRQMMVGTPSSLRSRRASASDRAKDLKAKTAEKKAAEAGGVSGNVIPLVK